MFGVNVWGVVHGIRAFLPIMLEQDEEAHVVNTASLAGLFPGNSVYAASKHTVVAISESLHAQLAQMQSRVGVSVLCPGVVQTRIFVAERNRPDALRDDDAAASSEAEIAQREQQFAERIGERIEGVMQPDAVAEQVFAAVQEQRFWILPHGDRADEVLKARFDSILERRNPEPPAAALASAAVATGGLRQGGGWLPGKGSNLDQGIQSCRTSAIERPGGCPMVPLVNLNQRSVCRPVPPGPGR